MFCVVVPFYQTFSEEEKKRIDKISHLYKGVPKYFITHDALAGTHNCSEFEDRVFDKKYFLSVRTYNEFCLTDDFYLEFSQYQFLLLIQLDVDLESSINPNVLAAYDFLGAPVFMKDRLIAFNGGYSWRRVDYCRSKLKEIHSEQSWSLIRKVSRNRLIALLKWLRRFNSIVINEDILYSYNLVNNVKYVEKSLLFSQEKHHQEFTELFGVPTGYHAKNKY